jgi:hypothetical protein
MSAGIAALSLVARGQNKKPPPASSSGIAKAFGRLDVGREIVLPRQTQTRPDRRAFGVIRRARGPIDTEQIAVIGESIELGLRKRIAGDGSVSV